jgi:hypothetical protein
MWVGRTLGTSLFVTKDHFLKGDVRLGDEVFFLGWFRNYFGKERNYPIVRFGRLSFRTDETISWGGKEQELYLIEAWPTLGTSGAPVFFRPSMQREPGNFVTGKQGLFLAGVLMGFYGSPPLVHTGIGAVAPASRLDEIISAEGFKDLKPLPGLANSEEKDVELCRQAETVWKEGHKRQTTNE